MPSPSIPVPFPGPVPADPTSNLSLTEVHVFHIKPEFKAFQGRVGKVQRLLGEFCTVVRTVSKLAYVLHVLGSEITQNPVLEANSSAVGMTAHSCHLYLLALDSLCGALLGPWSTGMERPEPSVAVSFS